MVGFLLVSIKIARSNPRTNSITLEMFQVVRADSFMESGEFGDELLSTFIDRDYYHPLIDGVKTFGIKKRGFCVFRCLEGRISSC